jgi:hypothetical protein
MTNVCILGMPGLYQNWLMSALDPSSECIESSDSNFLSKSKTLHWVRKFDTNVENVRQKYSIVINTHVKDENFVWYLYNFLEKTDGVGIKVDDLANDLFTKAPGTIAFSFMLDHFVDAYNITTKTAIEVINNSLVEYFYFLLMNKNSEFKIKSLREESDAINLEFDTFADYDALVTLLDQVPGFDAIHFQNMYNWLVARNHTYLNKKKRFKEKIVNHQNLDLLELAYVGYLVSNHTNTMLDWYNVDTRNSAVQTHRQLLLESV